MKTSIKSIAAAIALTAFVAGPASAMVLQGDLSRSVNSAIGSGSNVFATVEGETVTLTGYFADAGDQSRALQAAKQIAGVEKVINHAYQVN